MKKKRVLTGDRPTGATLPIAAYIGTLKSRVEGQDKYDTFVFIADYHALTTHFKETGDIHNNTIGLMKTYLSLGLDPEKVTFYRQSRIPETFRLQVILSMLTKMPELERQPMLKEKLALGHTLTFGLMGYPVLMASDILIMNSDLVPVAKDNEAHIEIAKDLGRRFNSTYGKVFNIPEGIIGEVVIGLDGQGKSGKSTGGIYFTDDTETVKKKVMGMYTLTLIEFMQQIREQ
jgi:tryptophanyl-tRNA synthetase